MRKICVHLTDRFCPGLDGLPKTLFIGSSQAELAGSVQHIHPSGMGLRQLFRHLPGAIRAVIVDHQKSQVFDRQSKQSGDQLGQVLRFIVCRDNNGQLHNILAGFLSNKLAGEVRF